MQIVRVRVAQAISRFPDASSVCITAAARPSLRRVCRYNIQLICGPLEAAVRVTSCCYKPIARRGVPRLRLLSQRLQYSHIRKNHATTQAAIQHCQ